jgi:hypothetical protein
MFITVADPIATYRCQYRLLLLLPDYTADVGTGYCCCCQVIITNVNTKLLMLLLLPDYITDVYTGG